MLDLVALATLSPPSMGVCAFLKRSLKFAPINWLNPGRPGSGQMAHFRRLNSFVMFVIPATRSNGVDALKTVGLFDR